MSRTLIRGGTVLTMGGSNHVEADVLIEDGWISEIAPGLRDRGAEVIDASEAIVMPGFVDAHRHLWRTIAKHFADPSVVEGLASHLEPDDVYASTLLGLLASAAAGTTTVVDWCDVAVSDAHLEAALQAHADSGLRTVFAPGSHIPKASWRTALDRVAAMSAEPLQTLSAGPPDPGVNGIDAVDDGIGHARELGIRSHVHVGTSDEQRGVVAEMARRRLLGDDVTLVHCTKLDGSDLDALAQAGSPVVLTPSTEMAKGVGMPPVQEFLDREIVIGLGVDDESLAPGDVFAQMRATISLQHAMYFDLKLVGKAGLPNLMSTREVIRCATIDGARAAGLADRTGSLEPGKRADLLVLRTDRPNIHPINDPIGAVVWGMDSSNLDWVLVAGSPVVERGESVADVAKVRDLAEAALLRVGERAGLVTVGEAGA